MINPEGHGLFQRCLIWHYNKLDFLPDWLSAVIMAIETLVIISIVVTLIFGGK